MKKIITSLFVFIFALVLTLPVLAQDDSYNSTSTNVASPVAPNSVTKAYKAREVVVIGSLTAISGKDLTVKLTRITPTTVKNYPGTYPAKDSSVIVHVVDKTKIVRKYNGKADFSEIAVGDALSVTGTLSADGTISARLVKDTSIAVTFYTRKGAITAIDTAGSNFTINNDTKIFKVFVTANTKFYKAGKIITLADLAVGDEVSVRGVVRQNVNEITADTVTIVTDKSDVEAKKQKAIDQEKARLNKIKENLQKQIDDINSKLEKLK